MDNVIWYVGYGGRLAHLPKGLVGTVVFNKTKSDCGVTTLSDRVATPHKSKCGRCLAALEKAQKSC